MVTVTTDDLRRVEQLEAAPARSGEGAMRNALALVRDHAPDSDLYRRALHAYRRSFARLRRTSPAPDEPAQAGPLPD